ncbi:hypothetical protein AVEN_74223-1 [Araneus ventricosus]|uniref:Uncharacterized protein n=1 Tax=Araneus ventricosus TaxID=182803 RepID=A0A4Y2ETQ9_ARAVE|nr:hypothetical protein AVEN_74223-1 [Araneus ventricosus]
MSTLTKSSGSRPLGKFQCYALGCYLRARYEGFITSDPNEVEVLSASERYCVNSAQSLVTALYAPNSDWEIVQKFPWQPIFVQHGNETVEKISLSFNELASAEPLDNRGLLTYREIFSKVRADNNRTWRIPYIHDWYQQKHTGAALELKGDRKLQTTITRFISGHTRTLSYVQGQKVFPVCLKCNTHQSTPVHLLSCMELEKRNLFGIPALVRDFLWAIGLGLAED